EILPVDRSGPPRAPALTEHEPERTVPGVRGRYVQRQVGAAVGLDPYCGRARAGRSRGRNLAAGAERERSSAGFRRDDQPVDVDAGLLARRRFDDVLPPVQRERAPGPVARLEVECAV